MRPPGLYSNQKKVKTSMLECKTQISYQIESWNVKCISAVNENRPSLYPLSDKFPADPSGYNTDTSLGRSLPANCGCKTGIVGEFCLLEPHNSSPPLLHSCRRPPDFLPRHQRLGFHTLGSSSSSSQKHNGKGGIFVGLCLKGREGKKKKKKTFCRTFTTQK